MSFWKWLIPVGVVGGIVAVVHAAHASSPAHPQLTSGKAVPDALKKSIESALESADPIVMRGLAAKIRTLGYGSQADSLEAAALAIEQAISGQPGAAPKLPARGAGLPAPTSERELAGRVALLYTGATPSQEGEEAKRTLKRFQQIETQRGFYVGNIDSLYGRKSALALAKDHHIIPPRPLYWPKKDVEGAKADYVAQLKQLGAKDPQRAEEWNQAAQAVYS